MAPTPSVSFFQIHLNTHLTHSARRTVPTGPRSPATAAVLARCGRVHAVTAAAARYSSDKRGPPAAVRAVPIKLISVAKGNSPGAALMAGTI